MKEYCNPINIEYKFQHYGNAAHREAADPTLVLFKDRYYLFASMSAGFYYSDDLVSWAWHENRELELYLYAPDVRQIGDYLYFCASDRKPTAIWRTKDPLSDNFEIVFRPFEFWDPNLFHDDDGKIYLYWGCGNKNPLYGIELNNDLMPIGEKTPLISENKNEHGWERFNYPGKEKQKSKGFILDTLMKILNRKGNPYIEGAYVNKWRGKYYLQFAAPATQEPVYADGVYIGDAPLGEYKYQKHNPFSYKPSGFINGAGHGSTIEDKYGNLWHASTMRISVNADFERRVGIFPAGIDADGILFCNQNFADYPIVVPEGKFNPCIIQPHFMLLSYKKKATVSSQIEGKEAELALNEDIRSWWCANGSNGEWYNLDLGKVYSVHSIQLNLAEEGIPAQKPNKEECSNDFITGNRYIDTSFKLRTRYIMEASVDGKSWSILKDASDVESDLTHDYIILKNNMRFRFIKVTAVELPYNQKFAISGLRVFGMDDGSKPEIVAESKVDIIDDLTCKISWSTSEDALGYNVRYGIASDKLYTSYLVYEKNSVLLTSLNAGVKYWYCIDSFNESGITEGETSMLNI